MDGCVEGDLTEELWTREEVDCVLPPPVPEGRKVYLRGNAKLPSRPYAQQHIQLIPKGPKCLVLVGPVRPSRLPSCILGCLHREYFPGLVKMPDGTWEPAWTLDHYKHAKDNSIYPNVASRVLNEFWAKWHEDRHRAEEAERELGEVKVTLQSHDARFASYDQLFTMLRVAGAPGDPIGWFPQPVAPGGYKPCDPN
ncbi:hypothetical protein ACQ4PT_008024 [Festuca glaucescens]